MNSKIVKLLENAEKQFMNGNFEESMQSYGFVLNEFPEYGEAKVGVYLSDLGLENAENAQALFDYYQIIKKEKEDAVEIIDNLIHALDNTSSVLQELLLDPMREGIEYNDGIRYEDFMTLVVSRGSFKQAFEDIMFSTKVIITNKKDFIDFVKRLANEGYESMALSYLDAASGIFGDDQEIYSLYNDFKGVKG